MLFFRSFVFHCILRPVYTSKFCCDFWCDFRLLMGICTPITVHWCTLIWTFITHPLVHIHQKKKIAPKIAGLNSKPTNPFLYIFHIPGSVSASGFTIIVSCRRGSGRRSCHELKTTSLRHSWSRDRFWQLETKWWRHSRGAHRWTEWYWREMRNDFTWE